jgi:hypothetical protein
MKVLTTILILILSINCIGQSKPFAGVSLHSIGYSLQIGVKTENRVLTIGYSTPITSALNPTLAFITTGREFDLGKDYALTTSTGYAFYNTIKSVKPMATIEASKDIYKGRLFITANYCKVFFAGAGFKIFII